MIKIGTFHCTAEDCDFKVKAKYDTELAVDKFCWHCDSPMVLCTQDEADELEDDYTFNRIVYEREDDVFDNIDLDNIDDDDCDDEDKNKKLIVKSYCHWWDDPT